MPLTLSIAIIDIRRVCVLAFSNTLNRPHIIITVNVNWVISVQTYLIIVYHCPIEFRRQVGWELGLGVGGRG